MNVKKERSQKHAPASWKPQENQGKKMEVEPKGGKVLN